MLHSFGRGTDGVSPNAGLIVDAAGNLYGTTIAGGILNLGTVFELTPSPGRRAGRRPCCIASATALTELILRPV